MTHNALATWDFTLSVRKSTEDHLEIIKELNQFAKKWTFQLEDSSLEPIENNCNSDCENDDEMMNSDTESIDTDFSSYNSDDCYSDNEDDSFDEFDTDEEMTTDSESESDGEGGYLHWQGKISLIKRRRKSELLSLLNTNKFFMCKAHFPQQ